MSKAFSRVCGSLEERSADDAPDSVRETVALRIVETAQGGERDVDRLCDDALAFLANSKNEKQA